MDIGMPELIIILFIVILIFGPGRLMKLGRDMGDGLRQFRSEIRDDQDLAEVNSAQENTEKLGSETFDSNELEIK